MNHSLSRSPTFVVEAAHLSDMGMRRMNNQDAVAVMVTDDHRTWASRGHLMMVADGMGAHAAGELASKLAADNIPHTYFKLKDLAPPAALRQAIRDANRVIHQKGQSSIGFHGMGTTCSCLVLVPQGALIAHIGDSRVYRLRGSLLEQLTFDHSLVWEMAAAGQMQETEVPAYIPKNVITRSLGPHPTVNVDIEGPFHADPGDVFLLCSDGLSGQINDEELGALLQCLRPKEAAQTLVDIANLRGGPDNISLVIARVTGDSGPAESQDKDAPNSDSAQANLPSLPAWIALAGCLAAIGFCVVNQYWVAAAVSAAVALALVAAWSYRAGASARANGGSIGGPYGNGPYRRIECGPTRNVAEALTEIAGKLRELPAKNFGNWNVNWAAFDEVCAQAVAAKNAGHFADAIRRYSQAIREIMQQLRDHRPTLNPNAGDG
jgi:protein phosphatase